MSAFDLSLLDGDMVPNELFFLREHFPPPSDLSSAAWSLPVGGKVITFDQLAAMPTKSLAVALECAENPAGGGLVSQAEWAGVSLAALLQPAPSSGFVRLSGADGFSRAIPAAKAIHPDTLLAYRMNGEKIPLNHGFPVRAIIPGWYGMDSVKWLREVELLAAEPPPQGYVRLEKSLLAGTRAAGPVTAIQVKSVFTRPQEGAILMSRRFICRGVAWAGEDRIRQVQVSTDGARNWLPARIAGSQPYAWTPWSFDWKIPRPGDYELIVRATDAQSREQPSGRPSARADEFEWNLWHRINVKVV